jgi:hypothetical protein
MTPPRPLSPPQQRRLLKRQEEAQQIRDQAKIVARQEKFDASLERWAKPLDKEPLVG